MGTTGIVLIVRVIVAIRVRKTTRMALIWFADRRLESAMPWRLGDGDLSCGGRQQPGEHGQLRLAAWAAGEAA
jgi:hypothetical protein